MPNKDENKVEMPEIETPDVTELEDADLEDVSGGTTTNNCDCNIT